MIIYIYYLMEHMMGILRTVVVRIEILKYIKGTILLLGLTIGKGPITFLFKKNAKKRQGIPDDNLVCAKLQTEHDTGPAQSPVRAARAR